MIIDAHCHVWPDHIAAKVLAGRPAGLDPVHDGTLDGLRRTMDAAGIDMAMCLGVANLARTVDRTNEFIGSVDRSRFIPFGTVHPGLSIEENLASLKRHGIRGVKLHPLFQELSLGDPAVVELLHALAEEGIVVITHAGAGGDEASNERGHPRHLRALTDGVPNLTLIACHYGGYHRLDTAEELVVGSRVVLETSWPPRLADLDPDRLRRIVAAHGADRMVFGSDWPMADPAAEIAAVRALGLTRQEEDAILGGTLARLLGIVEAD
ncbi:amidohydrolase family protein [Microbispora hainanensis]|uniref:amidohydrolase family protein n=1 Tax=Microbispora TaxID=2005 RepID=UPI0011CC1F88|nr:MULTISPECIES: amidohydrolase family protein [Microbispora]